MSARTKTSRSAMGESLIDLLRRPEAYPWEVEKVEVLQTHISWILFAGDRVLKVKKPIELDFLDYGTLDRRRHFCEEEVRLNSRLSPEIYHGVVPVTRSGGGTLQVEGEGKAVEWAVKMTRLPEERMLYRLLEKGDVGQDWIGSLARLLAGFHREAERGAGVGEHGSPEAIARKVLGNLDALDPYGGELLSEKLLDRLRLRARTFLDEEHDRLERRRRSGRVREGHGDLHAGNICFTGEGIVIFDCIEFSRDLRCGDVASDLSFLAMDLDFRGYPSASNALVESYARCAGDGEIGHLIRFYKEYRAAVRAKVAALAADEPGVSSKRSADKRSESRRYLQLAASYGLAPALILTCGLPGAGKSWAARNLARPLRAEVLRSDVVRKRIAGIPSRARGTDEWGQGIYSEGMSDRTYGRLLDDAASIVSSGRTAIVDASFATRARREPFVSRASELGCPLYVVHLTAGEEVVRRRMEERTDDPSDADFDTYLEARQSFEPPDEVESAVVGFAGESGATGEDLAASLIERRLD